MNFDFSDDQQAIKRTAKDLLSNRFTLERVRELAEAGPTTTTPGRSSASSAGRASSSTSSTAARASGRSS